MNINELINKYWKDVFNDKVTYLSTYRFERYKKFNTDTAMPLGWWAGTKKTYQDVVNFYIHKQKVEARKAHNEGVIKRFKESQQKKGS